MPIVIPDRPRPANASEEKVLNLLREQLGDDDVVVVGQRVTDHQKDHEIDFVVAIEGAGIVCIEVKGGEVLHTGVEWLQKIRGRFKTIDPVRQVRQARYALRNFVEADPRWNQPRPRWNHVIVLTNSALPHDFALADCPNWMAIDRDGLDDLGERLRQISLDQKTDLPLLTPVTMEQLRTALGGRGLPQRDVVARALENEDAADILTEQQAVILSAVQLLPRVEIRGGAGSGKTFMAVEQARRLAAKGQRVALICYSHGLASYLRRITADWSRRTKPGYVGEFHSLGIVWGAPEGPDENQRTRETSHFFEHELPATMLELATNLPHGQRFDAIVIDEAQDFADSWWDPVLAALRDPDEGGLYVFIDEGQRVFDRQGTPPVPLVPLILDQNIRNTRQIATAFQPLVDHPMRLLGGDGPEVRFVPCTEDDALDVGDDQVERLIEEGWRPEDVALLTTGSRHPEQQSRQAAGNIAYWDSFWDAEQVFYGHVLGFKGLERRAIVLVVNDRYALERASERLYVGLSRARDQLVVCGDPAFIRQYGGADVARRLGIDG
ncbi:MAG TPA: NERD domain-containing protein [Mycobacterium sp.]|nr:NERD domain-containing protein [Mycobacterium sp.]